MKYPKVGDKFYWKTEDGEIVEDVCQKIESNEGCETLYFTYISPNGGGEFLAESDILDPYSKEVKEFIKKQVQEKAKEICKEFENKDLMELFANKLVKDGFGYTWSYDILNTLFRDETESSN